MAPIYYRGADVGILVFDVNDLQSLEAVKLWIRELQQAAGVPEDIILVIAGNKADYDGDEEVPPDLWDNEVLTQARQLETDNKAKLFLTSAKTHLNLWKLFSYISETLVTIKKRKMELNTPKKMELWRQQSEEGKSSCC